MGKKSITKRWLLNNMGIILMIMMVLEMILIYVVQNYYYNSAKQYLTSKLNAVFFHFMLMTAPLIFRQK